MKNGQLIHISSVESGLKCTCICPSCGEHLIAKKGNKVVHHFAHKPNSECAYGYQTSLHLLAKEILFECKEITIPEVMLDFNKYGGTYKTIKIADSKRISLDKVVLEKKEGDVIPDIIVETKNYLLKYMLRTKLMKINTKNLRNWIFLLLKSI